MKVSRISGTPSPALARSLAAFETPFTYPLGPGRFFRITHCDDYPLFFRAMGDEACFVAQHHDRVVGVLGTAIRKLSMPDGTQTTTAYLGDLKIAPGARGGLVLARLAQAADDWLRPNVTSAFGVVMGGTSLLPSAYSGRAGIPPFQDVGRLMILRLSSQEKSPARDPGNFQTTPETGLACYARLSDGRYFCPPLDAQKRSQTTPVWLMNPDGSACGMLEDTRKAKRLINDDGSELLSAHLSCFACENPAAGAKLIKVALQNLAEFALPALFVAVADSDAEDLRGSLPGVTILAAPATVFGAGLKPGTWNINSSEI